MQRTVAALAVALAAAGCATAGAPAASTRNRPASYARPEPDPSCRGNLAQCLTVTGLEQVIPLRLLGCEQFEDGNVWLRYAVKAQSA